ncbi:hypothetical protein PPERSA_00409 [Pseudocohnilembus persalinus]|uniref:Ubiquitin-like domain-containing protein n=1 Tax=Pseudocohnilembus persalinus TaxID=266149 RepID=A0A0V0QYG1_PSEPJ|nr:hypothetical protein PPERSA_00409 [Pseudocohnilembus persalinus]|eukprot:KRX07252.1 hypothetical protein PPERSA_00409 [Pseudocohnilembus persalinus]
MSDADEWDDNEDVEQPQPLSDKIMITLNIVQPDSITQSINVEVPLNMTLNKLYETCKQLLSVDQAGQFNIRIMCNGNQVQENSVESITTLNLQPQILNTLDVHVEAIGGRIE